jgi:hypothetical protein
MYKLQKVIKFATKTHEVYQKQKRKGKEIPYITHPLAVGIILAGTGADEDVVCAGILHDTIEDSIPEKKVDFDMLKERFGEEVAGMVLDVTETDKNLPWDERKRLAQEHIKTFSHNSLLVKTADMVSNFSELLDDHRDVGDEVFLRFNAPKAKMIKNALETATVILDSWPENPLADELRYLAGKLQFLGALDFMPQYPAKIIEFNEYNENDPLECPVCLWKGTAKSSEWIEYHDDLLDVSCPNCEKMLLIVNYPLVRIRG